MKKIINYKIKNKKTKKQKNKKTKTKKIIVKYNSTNIKNEWKRIHCFEE